MQTQLATIDKAINAGHDDKYLIDLISKWDLQVGSDRNRDQLFNRERLPNELLPLLKEEQRLHHRVGKNHPQILSVRREIEETRNFFMTPDGDQAIEDKEVRGKYVAYLQQEVDRIVLLEQLYRDLYEAQYKEAKDLDIYQLTEEEFRRNMVRTQQLYDGVIEQLQEASIVKDYGGFRQTSSAPP